MRRLLNRFSLVNKSLKHYKINSLFFKLFLSIIIVSLVIAILSASAFMYFKSVLTEREITIQSVYLENNSMYLDNVIKRMEDSIYLIRNDNDLVRLSYLKNIDNYDKYRMVSNLSKRLNLVKSTLQGVNNIYVYLKTGNVIIDNAGLHFTDSYYGNRYVGNYSKWKAYLDGIYYSSMDAWEDEIREDSLQVVSRLNFETPIMTEGTRRGAIIINIDEDFISELLAGNEFAKDRLIYMVNGEGKILNSNVPNSFGQSLDMNSEEINSEGSYTSKDGYLVTQKKSLIHDLYYVIHTPTELFLGQIQGIFRVVYLLLTIFIITSIIIAFLLSQTLYTPVAEIMEFFNLYSKISSDGNAKKNELDAIRYKASEILSLNEELENTMKDSKPLIIDIIMLNTIIGGHGINHAISTMKKHNINFAPGYYLASVIRIDMGSTLADEWQQGAITFRSIIENRLSDLMITTIKTGKYEYTSIMHYEDSMIRERIILEMEEVYKELSTQLAQHDFFIGVGESFTDIFEVGKSYNQAVLAMENRQIQDQSPVFAGSYERKAAYIPGDMEQRLLNVFTSGNVEMAIMNVEAILNKNYNKNVSIISYNDVCLSINNLIKRIVNDWSFEVDNYAQEVTSNLIPIKKYMNWKLLKDDLIANVTTLTKYYEQKRDDNSTIDRVIMYIDNHFSQDINLEAVADQFNMNSSYLSRSFKQAKGVHFTDYLHQKRIDMAKELLLNSDMTIKDISAETGYNSVNIFIRTFKKYEGLTPGEYRKSMTVQ